MRSLFVLLPSALAVCALTAGCASEGSPPQEQLSRARTLVEQADKAGAQRYAAADLDRAHRELSDAENAAMAKRYTEARVEAESAAADADLAVARASAGDAERAAAEVVRGNATLRSETLRQADEAPAPYPAATPANPDPPPQR